MFRIYIALTAAALIIASATQASAARVVVHTGVGGEHRVGVGVGVTPRRAAVTFRRTARRVERREPFVRPAASGAGFDGGWGGQWGDGWGGGFWRAGGYGYGGGQSCCYCGCYPR
jgi:hypothetical protein